MIKQMLPNSDIGHAEMCRQVIARAAADLAAGQPLLRPESVAAVTAFLPTFEAAIFAREEAVQSRIEAVAACRAARIRVKHLIRDIWHEINRRVAHENYPRTLRVYYGLPLSGHYPKVNVHNMMMMAQVVIRGDADAVAAGYSATVGPTAAELEQAYQAAWECDVAKLQAKAEVARCQNAMGELRVQAADLCKLVRDELVFALRHLTLPQARTIMSLYGIRFVPVKSPAAADPLPEPAG